MTLVEMPTPATGPAAENLLRIAVVAPPWFKVPPDAYGGIEALVAGLVDGLVASGHQVTLIAAGPAGTRAQQHISVYEAPAHDPPLARRYPKCCTPRRQHAS